LGNIGREKSKNEIFAPFWGAAGSYPGEKISPYPFASFPTLKSIKNIENIDFL